MDWLAIGWSGFVAMVLALAVSWLFRSFGATQFSPTVQLGCVFVPNPRHPAAETSGFIVLMLLGTTVLSALYAAVYGVAKGPSWTAGLAVGVVHGIMTAAALPLFGTISACVRAGTVPAPGRFGIEWGWLTPLAVITGHGVYGAVHGAVLALF